MNIIKKIEQSYNSLAVKERKIAMFVIENSKAIQSMRITELAECTHTSIGSITRFCKKMQCKNYSDFKIQLAMSNGNSDYDKDFLDNNDTILKEVNMFYREVVNKNIQSIDEEKILSVSNSIVKANRVYVFGLGSSGLTAIELTNRLTRMGIIAFHCVDGDSMIISSTLMNENDTVIAISNSGNSQDIIEAVKLSKKNNATVIAFTSFSESPLTEHSDMVILVYNSLFLNSENFINTQFSLMYLIDILSVILLENPTLSHNMKKTIKAIHNK